MGDISDIPVDPVVNVLPVLKPGPLSLLSAARKAKVAPRDNVALTMIVQRLTVLRERLESDQGRGKGPGAGTPG
ncbi:MAG TPA: hypothetical protein ENJ52_01115 [Aliiroseovarius sp.]|nr:hypothetical protein [Aliiroseovarius sp.]